jgi:hypothetical protein
LVLVVLLEIITLELMALILCFQLLHQLAAVELAVEIEPLGQLVVLVVVQGVLSLLVLAGLGMGLLIRVLVVGTAPTTMLAVVVVLVLLAVVSHRPAEMASQTT